MARVKIDLPKEFPFSTIIHLRVSDLNYGGHLGNDAFLSLMHEARIRFLENLGLSEMDIGGTSMIMGDAAIEYKSEGFHGDEIEIKVGAGDFTRAGFDFYYKMINKTKGKDLAYAKTGMVCFDYKERKVKPVPEGFREMFV